MTSQIPLKDLLTDVRACRLCESELPLGPRPVVAISSTARLLIIGQAPGTRVHESGIPWNDPSGNRLRDWMQVSREQFYDESDIAIMPMGFCYPGKGKSGDLPPRPECAETWHERLLAEMSEVELILLIGQYAQARYLQDSYSSLTERVKAHHEFSPRYLPLPHPSPRNQLWLRKNSWFEEEVVPELRSRLRAMGIPESSD